MMMTRRKLLKNAGLAVAGVFAADQGAGAAYRGMAMNDYPQINAIINPNSDRTIIVAGGVGNDGIAIAHAMSGRLLPVGSILGIRYAETNVDPVLIVGLINKAIKQFKLEGNRFDAYLNSAAGTIMADPTRRLSRERRIGTVVLDGSPHDAGDVQGIEGLLIRDHADVLENSRALLLLSRWIANGQQPPATDKESDVPLLYTQANRRAIVDSDLITFGAQVETIRQGVAPGSMVGVAEEFVYMHSTGNDPLINNARAYAGWRLACGAVREVVDLHRPTASHAAGDNYPAGVAMVLSGASSAA